MTKDSTQCTEVSNIMRYDSPDSKEKNNTQIIKSIMQLSNYLTSHALNHKRREIDLLREECD